MYKVSFWSEALNKTVIRTFDNATEAAEFAKTKNGILICA